MTLLTERGFKMFKVKVYEKDILNQKLTIIAEIYGETAKEAEKTAKELFNSRKDFYEYSLPFAI